MKKDIQVAILTALVSGVIAVLGSTYSVSKELGKAHDIWQQERKLLLQEHMLKEKIRMLREMSTTATKYISASELIQSSFLNWVIYDEFGKHLGSQEDTEFSKELKTRIPEAHKNRITAAQERSSTWSSMVANIRLTNLLFGESVKTPTKQFTDYMSSSRPPTRIPEPEVRGLIITCVKNKESPQDCMSSTVSKYSGKISDPIFREHIEAILTSMHKHISNHLYN